MLPSIDQLSLDEQDHLIQISQIYDWIKEGEFLSAYKQLEKLLQEVQNDNNLYHLMRQLHFWKDWSEKVDTTADRVEQCNQWLRYYSDFETFVKKYHSYKAKDFDFFKKAVYKKVIDYYIYLFNDDDNIHIERLLRLSEYLIAVEEYGKAEETLLFLRKKNEIKTPKIDFLLVEVFYLQREEKKALGHLKDSFFWHDQYSCQDVVIEPAYFIVNQMLASGYNDAEVALWLPIEMKLAGLFEDTQACEGEMFRQVVNRVKYLKKCYDEDSTFYESRLLYAYIYLMDKLQCKISLGKIEFCEELEHLLSLVAKLQPKVYQKIKNYYE